MMPHPLRELPKPKLTLPITNSSRLIRIFLSCCNIGRSRLRPNTTATKGTNNSRLAYELNTKHDAISHCRLSPWVRISSAVFAKSSVSSGLMISVAMLIISSIGIGRAAKRSTLLSQPGGPP